MSRPTRPLVQATASAPAARPRSAPTDMRSRNAATDVRPSMHKAAADVHAMPPAEAGRGVEGVVPVAAIRPSPSAKVMRASRPAVHLVGEVGVFDGVTQAVSATECNGRSRFGERAEGHDRSGCHGECKDLHGFPPDRTCRSPPSHVDSFSNKRFHNRSWLNHLSRIHIQLTASVVQCILVRSHLVGWVERSETHRSE
jgi:hypothetical protein